MLKGKSKADDKDLDKDAGGLEAVPCRTEWGREDHLYQAFCAGCMSPKENSCFDKPLDEKVLVEALKKAGIIYVSHRLSSCKFCSKITVFEGGRLVE
ncbi:MAG: hypothetical protein FWJ59_01680 [Caldicoprobacter sp.]|uniref:hypothetical protein n=1 Tax=Caldicoprobacter sp. TaxID=2004500 RepID=UPI001D5A21EB|nr:hypothetical protein [Clostridia bacterium]